MEWNVYQFEPDSGQRLLLVNFKLVGKKVKAEWQPESLFFKTSLEQNGIATAKGIFTPNDGKKFMSNLPIAFANSSTIDVVDATKVKFGDANFDFMTVYDKKGNPVQSE